MLHDLTFHFREVEGIFFFSHSSNFHPPPPEIFRSQTHLPRRLIPYNRKRLAYRFKAPTHRLKCIAMTTLGDNRALSGLQSKIAVAPCSAVSSWK